ncbi:MAG: PfkB family carbohydrate kinase, partial [archaeon]|nr:PfkB family carbohydrate kinase [archaeon]
APTIYNAVIKDPTGAGDTFSGGFLTSYHKIRDPVRSAIVGNTLASIKSSGRGYDKILNLKFRKVDDLWNYVMTKSHNMGAQKILSEF